MLDMICFLRKYLVKSKKLFFLVNFINIMSVGLSAIKMILVYFVVDSVLKMEISFKILLYIFIYLLLYLLKRMNDNSFSRVLQERMTKDARVDLVRRVCENKNVEEVDNGEMLTLHDIYIPQIMDFTVDTINGFWGMCSVIIVNQCQLVKYWVRFCYRGLT